MTMPLSPLSSGNSEMKKGKSSSESFGVNREGSTARTESHASNLRAHQTAVLVWNRFYPVGTPVLVKRDDDSVIETATTSEAQLLGGHTAVVWLRDIRGAYLLDRVSPRVGL